MRRKSFATMECPTARASDVLGDGWTLLIVRTALLGARQFQEFEARLEIPPSTLSRKLDELCRQRILRRVRYRTRPARDEYRLTQKGRELFPVVLTLMAWGSRWLSPGGPPLLALRCDSGLPVQPIVCDAESRHELAPGDVCIVPGPTASAGLRAALTAPIRLGDPEAA